MCHTIFQLKKSDTFLFFYAASSYPACFFEFSFGRQRTVPQKDILVLDLSTDKVTYSSWLKD